MNSGPYSKNCSSLDRKGRTGVGGVGVVGSGMKEKSVVKRKKVRDGKSQSEKGRENEVIFKSVEVSKSLFCRRLK